MHTTAITLAAAQERFLTHHKARNHSPRQIEHYERTFHDFDRYLEAAKLAPVIKTLTTPNMDGFAVWLRETPIRPYRRSTQRSESGIHGHLKDTKAFIRWCADPDQGFITWPVKVVLPKLPRMLFPIFTQDELVALFASRHLTGETEYALRNRALIALLLDSGLRLTEAAMLTPRSIIGKQYVQVTGKGHKERQVPFSSATLLRLEAWLDARSMSGPPAPTDDDPLFLLKPHGIKQFMRRLSADTGLHAHAHKLRHQSTTEMIRRNADHSAVQRMLGHATLASLQGYISLSNADLASQHALASPFAALDALLPHSPTPKRRRLKS